MWVGVEAPGNEGKRGGDLPISSFLTALIELGVAEDSKDLQWEDFAALMALKYPLLESRAAS